MRSKQKRDILTEKQESGIAIEKRDFPSEDVNVDTYAIDRKLRLKEACHGMATLGDRWSVVSDVLAASALALSDLYVSATCTDLQQQGDNSN